MWGAYLVHKRILVIDKQLEHAVGYFSKAKIEVVAHIYIYYEKHMPAG